MYKVIKNHPSALQIYQNKLLESGQVTKEDIDQINSKVASILNEEFLARKEYKPQRRDWLSAYWAGFKSPEQISRVHNTDVKLEILKNVGKFIVFQRNFNLIEQLRGFLKTVQKLLRQGSVLTGQWVKPSRLQHCL